MKQAGMTCREDPAGNLIGRYEAGEPDGAASLMMGSHQDTVRDGGRYDGMLGIVAPISAVERLYRDGVRLPFAVEVVAFTDEEGARFQTTLLGSKAIAGTLDPSVLEARDGDGVTIAEAMREFGADPERIAEAAYPPGSLLAFVETHIEQGPQLEGTDRPLGVVTSVAGGTRMEITRAGGAGNAGTVPMNWRRDALMGAAEAALAIERYCRDDGNLVGTVGRIAVRPGAVNVIPGEAVFTADIRAPEDAQRRSAVDSLRRRIKAVAAERGLECRIRVLYDADGCTCEPRLVEALSAAVAAEGYDALPEGARVYLEYVSEELDTPVYAVGVGPGRDQSIVRQDPWDA
jgi:allantoate deiminase